MQTVRINLACCRETGVCAGFLFGSRSGRAEVRVVHEGGPGIPVTVSTGSSLYGQK